MNITVWKNFKKRKNSTMQPGNTGTVISNVRLKDNCNFENPVFLLNQIDFSINYIQAFGKYYYVESIDILSADHAAYNCTMDLLASYKSDIQATSACIERSASAYDKNIVDELVPLYPSSKIYLHEFGDLKLSATGCYICQLISDSANNGALTTLALTRAQFQNLIAWINAQDQAFINWVMLQYGNAMDWIANCFWLPVAVSNIPGSDVAIKCGPGGSIDTGVSGRLISGEGLITISQLSVTPSELPDDFRRSERYCNVEVYLPYIGLVNVPIGKIRSGGSVRLTTYIDLFAGECFYKLDCSADSKVEYITTVSTSISSNIPLARENIGAAVGLATSTAILGASILTGNVVGAVSGTENLLSKFADPGVCVRGSYGGRSMRMETAAYMFIQTMDTGSLTELNTNHGRPLYKTRTLSTLSGYCKCRDASVSCDATSAQTSQINQLLNSGIYLE